MAIALLILRRALATLPLLLGISLVSFTIIYAVPGDYATQWLERAMAMSGQSRETLEPMAQALRERLGLDQPFYIQYWRWITGIVLAGDFGESFFHARPVTEVIGLRFWRTLILAIITILVSQVAGVLLGIYAAMNQYKWGDMLATLVAFIGIVVPKFVVALLVLYLLSFVWRSPYIGQVLSAEFIVQDYWSFAKAWNFFLHTWPVLVISIWAGQAYTLRIMRGNLLDVMNTQYIETARAKGLSRRKIIFKHGVPNALHPIIMNQGGRLDYIVKGEIEIAIVLGIPTIGPLILSSVANRDMYVVSAIFLMVAVILVIGNALADIALALIDPRVREASMSEGNG